MPPRTSTPPFLSARERRWDKLSGRREDDGRVEFFGRLFGGFAGPHSAQLQRELLMLRSARCSVHFNAPMPRDLNRDVRRRSEAVKREAPAALDSRKAQAAKPDDAGAQQRRGVLVGKRFGDRVNEILRRDC